MINIKENFYLKITVVIPTYNRRKYLFRSVKYWEDLNVSVIIADGSDKELESNIVSSFGNKTRYIYDKKNLVERLSGICNYISTEYVCMMGDDEFYLSSSVLQAIKELEQDHELVACMGEAIGFRYKSGKIEYKNVYPELRGYIIENDCRWDRIRRHMQNYACSTIYAVCRKKSWIWAIQESSTVNCNVFSIFEYSFEILMSCEGKSKIIPYLHWMRSFEEGPAQHYNEINIVYWWFSKSRQAEKEKYLTLLIDSISKRYKIKADLVYLPLTEAIEGFIMRAIRDNTTKITNLRWIILDLLNYSTPRIVSLIRLFMYYALIFKSPKKNIHIDDGKDIVGIGLTHEMIVNELYNKNIFVNIEELNQITLTVTKFHKKYNI